MPDAIFNDWSVVLGAADDPKLAWFLTAAAAALGASVGSFLNVVVYRLPRGISLSHPGSRCPHCLHAIRWFDNVPVLGWLWLGGRCRDCRAPIAARYPLVETLVASLTAALFWLEVIGHGTNLPGSEALGGETPPVLPWLRYGYHLLLVLTLVAAGFMAYDRQRLPLRLWAPALVVGFFAPLVWPGLRPIPAFPSLEPFVGPLRGAIDGIAGISLSANLGFMAMHPWRASSGRRSGGKLRSKLASSIEHRSDEFRESSLEKRDQAALTAIVGLFLGWQAAWGMLLVALLLDGLFNRLAPADRRGWITLPVWSSIVTLASLFYWRGVLRGIEFALSGAMRGLALYVLAFFVLVNLAARWRPAPNAVGQRNS